MASQVIKVSAVQAAATVNGTATGYITVADNTKFTVGSIGLLSGNGLPTVEVQIVELPAANLVGLRPTFKAGGAPTYGRMDLSAYTTVAVTTLSVDSQVIFTAY